jgi:alpha-mannosidase
MKYGPISHQKSRGQFSGSPRQDESRLEEYDLDSPDTYQMWFVDLQSDPDFLEEIQEIMQGWKATIANTVPDINKVLLGFMGNSHLDVAYKWRYQQTVRKAVKTLSKAVRHCGLFPNQFAFTMSTPLAFAWIKENEPALFEEIKKYVANGQIEIVGGSWVESDGVMPCGEAMIRHRLYGMRFYRDEFNKFPLVEFFPDSFGFNRGLPQIFAKTGAEFFLTNKMTWCLYNKFPFVHFWWQSPDGSRVFADLDSVGRGIFSRWKDFGPYRYCLKKGGQERWSYDDDLSQVPEHLDKSHPSYVIPVFVGKGDGGHGPVHQEVAEMLAYMKMADKVGLKAKWVTADEICRMMLNDEKPLPIWTDELYLEDHQGTTTVHSEVKRHNRRLENLILAVESLMALKWFNDKGFSYPYEALESLWKLLLLNQFHDVLPGSCIPEVLDDASDVWDQIDGDATMLIQSVASAENTSDACFTIYNPLSWKRRERVFIPWNSLLGALDGSGKPPYKSLQYERDGTRTSAICQPVAAEPQDLMKNHPAGWWALIEIPAYGMITAELTPNTTHQVHEKEIFVSLTPNPYIQNSLAHVELDPKTGAVKSYRVNSLNNGENCLAGDENNLMLGFLDDSERYPAWNLMPEYWKYPKQYDQSQNVKISVLDDGPVFMSLKVEKILGISPMVQIIRLFAGDPKVYCLWSSNWQEKNVLLKVPFQTIIDTPYSVADGMFCCNKRRTKPENPWDKERFEKNMHKYVDLSLPSHEWGFAVLNEGKYAYDTLDPQTVRISLHRSPKYPDPASEAWVQSERQQRLKTEGTSVPSHIGIGKTSAHYTLFLHGSDSIAQAEKLGNVGVRIAAEEFNTPLLVITGHPSFSFNTIVERVEPSNIIISALKVNEWEKKPQLIIRIAEICGIKGNGSIFFSFYFTQKFGNVQEVDYLERPLNRPVLWRKELRCLEINLAPFEVVSVAFDLLS